MWSFERLFLFYRARVNKEKLFCYRDFHDHTLIFMEMFEIKFRWCKWIQLWYHWGQMNWPRKPLAHQPDSRHYFNWGMCVFTSLSVCDWIWMGGWYDFICMIHYTVLIQSDLWLSHWSFINVIGNFTNIISAIYTDTRHTNDALCCCCCSFFLFTHENYQKTKFSKQWEQKRGVRRVKEWINGNSNVCKTNLITQW